MAKQDLEIRTKATDADKTAADLGKIKSAQDGVVSGTKDQKPAVEGLTDAQKKLNAAEGDWYSLLNQVDPRLGLVADQLMKFTKIMGSAGAAQISFTDLLKKTAAGLRANADALKLVGAGAAAAGAIWLVVRAYKALGEEAKAATEALNKSAEATIAARVEHEKSAESLRKEADQRERMPTLTTEGAEAIKRESEMYARRFPAIDAAQAEKSLVMMAQSGIAKDKQEAILLLQAGGGQFGIEPGATAEERASDVDAKLAEGRSRELVREGVQRSDIARRRIAQDLMEEARAGQGPQIEALASRFTDDPAAQKKLLQSIADVGGTKGGYDQAFADGGWGESIWNWATGGGGKGFGPASMGSQSREGAFGFQKGVDLTANEVSQLTGAILALDQTMRIGGQSVGIQYRFGETATTTYSNASSGQRVRDEVREGG